MHKHSKNTLFFILPLLLSIPPFFWMTIHSLVEKESEVIVFSAESEWK